MYQWTLPQLRIILDARIQRMSEQEKKQEEERRDEHAGSIHDLKFWFSRWGVS